MRTTEDTSRTGSAGPVTGAELVTGAAPADPDAGADASAGAGAGGRGPRHGIARFTAAADVALDRLDAGGPGPAWSMTPAEQTHPLHRLIALAARVEELTLRVLTAPATPPPPPDGTLRFHRRT